MAASFTCKVIIQNVENPSSGFRIVLISGSFQYMDGSFSYFGNAPVNHVSVGGGESVNYLSQDKCVTHIHFFLKGRLAPFPDVTQDFDRPVTPGKCLAGEVVYDVDRQPSDDSTGTAGPTAIRASSHHSFWRAARPKGGREKSPARTAASAKMSSAKVDQPKGTRSRSRPSPKKSPDE